MGARRVTFPFLELQYNRGTDRPQLGATLFYLCLESDVGHIRIYFFTLLSISLLLSLLSLSFFTLYISSFYSFLSLNFPLLSLIVFLFLPWMWLCAFHFFRSIVSSVRPFFYNHFRFSLAIVLYFLSVCFPLYTF